MKGGETGDGSREAGAAGITARVPPAGRILVLALSGIGDTLIATPFLHELRANFPEARIEALVLWPGAKGLLADNPNLDAVHQHDFLKASKLASLRFVLGLRRNRYDLSVNTHTQGRRGYRVIARLIGARVRLSHEYENHGWPDRWLVTHSLPQDYTVHSAVNNNRLLGLIGKRPLLPRHEYELFLSPAEETWATQYLAKNRLTGKAFLGIHVGSGGTKNLALRRWPLNRYLELVTRLQRELPELPVLFFGGPDERAAHEPLWNQLRSGPVFFPESPGVRHAAALLRHAQAFLSVDTLFMHLAAAVRVPRQFVIETPTVNPPILPLREGWTLIPNPAVAGRNLDFYRYDGRPIRGTKAELRALMESVTVEAVLAQLRSALKSA
jgi:ADP-heptose:LPS heptosyltransferase